MDTMTRTIKIFGRNTTITFHIPTNEEYNAYGGKVQRMLKDEDEDGLVAFRAKQFDAWTIEAPALPDRIKSSIMFQIYDLVDVDEKN